MSDGKAAEPGPDAARWFAIHFNNAVWELLGKADRTADEDRRMVHAAHASHLHWLTAGTIVHQQRGLWLIARVYAELGNGAEALQYARACERVTAAATAELEDYDRAYSLEALARAHAVAGDLTAAAAYRAQALAAAEAVARPESRKLVLADLRDGNWGALSVD